MKRSVTVSKKRPEHWSEGPDLGRHETSFGFTDIEEKGREITSKTLPHGPKPVAVPSKRKHRRPA